MGWARTSWIGTDSLPPGMTHLALPLLVRDQAGNLRCFATARDASSRSHPVTAPAAFDNNGSLSLVASWQVVAPLGEAGRFDESGLSLSSVRSTPDGFECLTFGWRLRSGGGWFNEVGRMMLDHNARLLSRDAAPWLPRTRLDPISMAYPSHAGRSEILYCAPSRLDRGTGRPADFLLMRAEIGSGRRSVVADPREFRLAGVFAFSRPWVHKEGGRSHLWFCMRGERYRIVRAVGDGLANEAPIHELVEEFPALSDDREAGSVCYPSISRQGSLLVMLYNGTRYGASGFGVAVQDEAEFAK